MKNKCCGNCKHLTNEDVNGYGWCSSLLTRTTCGSGICRKYEMPNNGWTEITPDNVDEIKSIESNRVIICASNGIGYMYPLTLLSLECSLESIADYGGHYYFVLPELKIE